MDFDDTKFPNTDPNLVARGHLTNGGVWHQFKRDGGSCFRFEKDGIINYHELTSEQMMIIAARTYNS